MLVMNLKIFMFINFVFLLLTFSPGNRVMLQTSFLKIWKQFVPSIVICRPMSDLCWQCQKNNLAVYQSANLSEEEKEARANEHLRHLDSAKQQRAVLQGMTAANRNNDDITSRKLGPNPPCSVDLTVHYSFDYAQQVHYPSNPLQPGPMYFMTPRKCGVFGVSCEGVNQQVRYYIFMFIYVFAQLTLKGPGFFVYLKSGGGGADSAPPPPRISAAERRKILKFGTYVELVNTNVLTKFQYLKSKHF